jgi:hypothetical protein
MTLRYWFAVAAVCLGATAQAARFDFMALGDTAYRLPEDLPIYEALIDKINSAEPAFSIHVGDIWGANVCTEAEYKKVLAQFQRFRQPVVFTPGDNEWVDCRQPEVISAYIRYLRGEAEPADLAILGPLQGFDASHARAGYDDVLARLTDIRRIFFPRPESLGATAMPLARQSEAQSAEGTTDYPEFVENAKWLHQGVQFVTVHVTGSQNNFYINDEAVAAEAARRHRATIAWLQSAFADAKAADARALVIAMHAQLFLTGSGDENFGRPVRGGGEGPFFWIARAIRDLGSAFGRPVLVIHGDFHEFIVDRPFLVSAGEETPPKHDNITRLQVYGAPDVRAVRVSVDTDTPWVFGFTPLY